MEAWLAFAGAVVGGFVAGGWNLVLQYRQHKHAAKMRQQQWDRESVERQAEWDHQRREREIQIEEDRQLQRDRDQRETMRELQIVMPVLGRAARTLYEERRSAYLELQRSGASEGEFLPSESFQEYGKQYNDLDQNFVTLLSRVENEKIRTAGGMLYQLDRQMALLRPSTWDSRDLHGGRTPTYLAIDREHQLTRMIGKVLRGESIDNEVVEEFVHQSTEG